MSIKIRNNSEITNNYEFQRIGSTNCSCRCQNKQLTHFYFKGIYFPDK